MMRIRKMRPDDAESLPAIERSAARAFASVPELAWLVDGAVQSADRHLELMAGGHSWVATDPDDGPIGFLSAERFDDVLHIWEMSVGYDFQGLGLGRALLTHAFDEARLQGLTAVTLTTFRGVEWNEPFYKRIGFRTLSEDSVPARLQSILDAEAAYGLSAEQRCAMTLAL